MPVGAYPGERLRPMAELINDRFMACADCAPVLANGDYTHLDYYYASNDQSGEIPLEAMMKAIDEGMDNAGGYIMRGDQEQDDEFSTEWCDCCGTHLAGSRTHFVVLGD